MRPVSSLTRLTYLSCTCRALWRSFHGKIGHMTQLKTKNINFLVFRQFYLNFAVFLSKFRKPTFYWILFIIKRKLWGEIICFTIMPNGKWKSVLNYCPPTLDTAFPNKHDFIFIKEVDTTNGVLYLGGGGGGDNVIMWLLVLREGEWRWHEIIFFYFSLNYAQY